MGFGLGIDIAGVEDVDLFLSSADAPTSAAEAAARSILHAPGVLWWAPDLGHDVRQYIHGTGDPKQIEHNVRAAVEADERIKSGDVLAEVFGKELRLTIKLLLINSSTPVTLTVRIDELGKVLDASVSV